MRYGRIEIRTCELMGGWGMGHWDGVYGIMGIGHGNVLRARLIEVRAYELMGRWGVGHRDVVYGIMGVWDYVGMGLWVWECKWYLKSQNGRGLSRD